MLKSLNSVKDDSSSLAKYIVDGPIFFGTAKVFEDKYPAIFLTGAKKIILDLEHLSVIDATGEAALYALLDDADKAGVQIIIKRLPKEKLSLFKKSGLYDRIGEDNFFM